MNLLHDRKFGKHFQSFKNYRDLCSDQFLGEAQFYLFLITCTESRQNGVRNHVV